MNIGFETLRSLLFISSETQTEVDDFLYLARNTLESQLSSVETSVLRLAQSISVSNFY